LSTLEPPRADGQSTYPIARDRRRGIAIAGAVLAALRAVVLYDTTQYVSGARKTVAKALGLDPAQVTVICPYVGGGFGCKGSVWSHVVLAALARSRRPTARARCSD